MLRILLGRARTGKSARVLEEIRALGDSSQQILLVRSTLRTSRRWTCAARAV